MTFKQAVEQTPHLKQAWRKGLGALRAQDKPHVAAEDTRRLAGSVDVDRAMQSAEPHAHRWDFAIGYRHTNRKQDCLYWVEIHSGLDKEVKVVLEKLQWLKAWLAGAGRRLDGFEREFVWISSGVTSFTLSAPQRKRFAMMGLQHKGSVLRIPNARSGSNPAAPHLMRAS